MLGPRVLASQTQVKPKSNPRCSSRYTIGYTRRQGAKFTLLLRWPAAAVVGTVFSMAYKSCARGQGGATECQKVTVPHYGSLPPNPRMLSWLSGACYQ